MVGEEKFVSAQSCAQTEVSHALHKITPVCSMSELFNFREFAAHPINTLFLKLPLSARSF
jgi:hypothetical protein